MENINNTITPETPIQPIETPITPEPIPTPPKSNLFKYLFIISIVVLLIVITGFFLNDKGTKQPLVEENINNVSTVIPTKIVNQVTPTDISKVNNEYEASFIKDDKNSISKLVLIDKNKKETIVSETKYFDMAGQTLKPEYRFVFSSDKNYLVYNLSTYEGGVSGVYDIKNKIKVDIPFFASSINFDDSNTFFYACDEGGIAGGGAVIYKLPGLTSVYNKAGSFNCEYNKISNSLNIFEDSSSGQKLEQFSFTSGTLLK